MRKTLPLLAGAAALAATGTAAAAKDVNIYSYRQAVLMKPLLDRFQEKTGIKANVVYLKKGMMARLKAEGAASPADVILTVDASRLIRLDRMGSFQPLDSAALTAAVPANLRHPKGHWFGLTARGRPIYYNPAKVKPSELSTYEALADGKWKGRICIRSSSNVYNQSLIASIIAANGVEKAQAWANGFVKNFARKPAGGDRDQIRAVAAGECDIAIANTYYFAGLAKSKKERDRKAAAAVRLFWPNQKGRGAHVNISGAGVAKHSKNRANAVKLIEFLASREAQEIYARIVNEYPVRKDVQPGRIVADFGEFKADSLPLSELAKYQKEAVRLADRAGWR
ncbi:MAG: Fe(3+) ABC transporter substrate-binding protein [Rhodospirillaceae bacterium]|nr:Fe(3+) ABC transporter substrate-binding protein [Rhodospirillaceae bacterium]